MDSCRAKVILLALLLTGCEALDTQEQPVDVVCSAECQECREVLLECRGTGRGITEMQKKVSKP